MARRKKRIKAKFKRARRGMIPAIDSVTLICYQCNTTREFARQPGEDVDQILDREAIGWYTISNGIALCPRHVIESGASTRPLYPFSEIIYGDPEQRRANFERMMERTRRRMKRLSWKSATSEDCTTSETS